MQSFRMTLVQKLGQTLPPLFASRIRQLLYPMHKASQEDIAFTARAQTGSRLQGRTRDHHAYVFAFHGYYDWRVWAIACAVCKSGDTIVEVGANIGTETIAFADIVGPYGEVFCFEPLPANVEQLEANVQLNGYKHVHVLPYAVGAQCGAVSFSPPRRKSLSGSGRVTLEHTDDAITVRAITLDSMTEDLTGTRFVHADAEGSEIFILRGASSLLMRDRPVLFLEASPKMFGRHDLSLHDLDDLLHEHQYKAFRLGRLAIDPVTEKELESRRMSNWLCLPVEKEYLLAHIKWTMWRAYLMPVVPQLNPLANNR